MPSTRNTAGSAPRTRNARIAGHFPAAVFTRLILRIRHWQV
jgi:hypothetical protein